MNIIRKLRASIRLNEAVVQADKAHEETGERYYVMPNGKSGKLIIMDRFNFRKLKQKGYVSHNVFVNDLYVRRKQRQRDILIDLYWQLCYMMRVSVICQMYQDL